MQHAAPPVNSVPQTRALAVLRNASERGRTARDLGAEIGTDHTTVARWLRGDREPTGEKLQLLIAWAEQQPAPSGPASNDYERGVLYACEAMSETIARLLREQRESDDALRARALAAIPPAASAADPVASETRRPRRRRGIG